MTQNVTPPLLPTLPMHLMLTMGCWLSQPFVLQCAKSVLPPLSKSSKKLPPKEAQKLEAALAEEAKSRASDLLAGILKYVDSNYTRTTTEAPTIWRKGNARLLDYGQNETSTADRPVVLFIPSLINRYYILDLEEERSMLRYAAEQGLYPLVMDWGTPGEFEESFDCADYVTEILNPAIDFISKTSGQKIILAGYCMGGVLALAATKLKASKISALALFATPWDFHCKDFKSFVLDKQWRPGIQSMIEANHQLSAEIVQSLFYLTDPWVFEQKFRRFADLQPESRAAKDFIALEHWVNDGVPMTKNVGHDCLIGWVQENILKEKQWQVGGKKIDPKSLKLPIFMAIPKNDHVVPLDCAMSLAHLMPHAKRIHPSAGHVGMIVGSRAKRELWQPFVEWVHTLVIA